MNIESMTPIRSAFHPGRDGRRGPVPIGTCLILTVAAWWCDPLVAAGAAESPNMNITAAGIELGGHVSGPKLTAESLAHHVVVLEFWGVNCPPCIASMPKLEAIHRQYGPSGLMVVGAHAQDATPAEIQKMVGELGVTFPIVAKAQVAGGMDFSGIPHCMVFDHEGRCIFRGSPTDAHDKIVAAVRTAPSAVLEGRQLVKLAAFNKMLQDESGLAGAMRKAKGLTAVKDEETAAEARFVIEKIEAHGRRMLEQAVEAKASDPFHAAHLLQRCAAGFKGTEIGTEAAKLAREWKKDKPFQDAVKAVQQAGQLEAMRNQILKAFGVEGIATPDMVAKVPPAVKKQMGEIAASVQQTLPGSTYADRAAEVSLEFGLDAAGAP